MSLLKALNRHMERNQVARMAIMEVFEKSKIKDLDDFSLKLWEQIKESQIREGQLEWINSDELPFEFVVKLLIKIGFSCDNAARFLMTLHKQGRIVLAVADKESLLKLKQYMDFQARKHGLNLTIQIRVAEQ